MMNNEILNGMNSKDEGIDIDNFDKEDEITKLCKLYTPTPLKVAMRLYTAPQITTKGLIIPVKTHETQQYEVCVGLVFALGSACYKDEKYKLTGPWCKVGDWIDIARHSGTRKTLDGIPIFIIWEDSVDGIVTDPRVITR